METAAMERRRPWRDGGDGETAAMDRRRRWTDGGDGDGGDGQTAAMETAAMETAAMEAAALDTAEEETGAGKTETPADVLMAAAAERIRVGTRCMALCNKNGWCDATIVGVREAKQALLPDGWSETVHHANARSYSSYHGPNGERANSRKEAFRIHGAARDEGSSASDAKGTVNEPGGPAPASEEKEGKHERLHARHAKDATQQSSKPAPASDEKEAKPSSGTKQAALPNGWSETVHHANSKSYSSR